MKIPIKTLRKIKAFLIRIHIHILVGPFQKLLLTLVYTSRLSKWIRDTLAPEFTDYYSKTHDYQKRYELYKYLIKSENLEHIHYFEFGVSKGISFRWWVKHIDNIESRFFGFDTFTGLPDAWGRFKKGDMASGRKPRRPDTKRCYFCKGLFQATLPIFLKHLYGLKCPVRKVIHMDADLYESTIFVLISISPYIRIDDIIIFDEFNVPLGEFRAFYDFVSISKMEFKLLGCQNNYHQVAFKRIA